MDTELLEAYKKKRTLLQKSFINRLNNSLQDFLEEWNELPLIKQTLFRLKFDTIVNDTSKKIKDEITRLRVIKKTVADNIMRNDIENIINCKKEIPESKNPYEWITKFRSKFLNMDCFARLVLFDRIDCKDLWDYDIMHKVDNSNLPDLENKAPEEQTNIMFNIVNNLTINPDNSKYIEEPTDEFFDTLSGQMSMNI